MSNTWGKISTSEDGERFFVNGSYDVLERASAVPGARWTKTGKGVHVKASPSTAADMVAALQGIDIQYDDAWESYYSRWSEQTSAAEIARVATAEELPRFASQTDPWLHQKQAFWFLRALPAGALFSDMGTGKTKVVVDLICNDEDQNVLIIGPLKAVEDGLWSREFERHGMSIRREIRVTELGPSEGKISHRALRIAGEYSDAWTDHASVFVINYECLDQEVMRDALLAVPWDLVVLDESHRIKAVTGVRSKFLGKLGRQVHRRLCLTGTPNADKPIDVWGQFRFLEPSIFGNYGEFKREYCYLRLMPNGAGGYFEKIEGYKNLDQLAERMASVSFRVTADVLDLPDQHDVVRSVRLGREAQDIYDRMEKEALGAVEEDNDVIAGNVLTRYLRLQEITSGYLRSDEPGSVGDRGGETSRAVRRFDTSKADATVEIVEDINEPVVIFYRFTQDADILHEKLQAKSRTTYELSGRLNRLHQWKEYADAENAVLLVQVASGSEAIDLTTARYVVYYSTDFSLSHYQQSRKRVHRPGQTRPVTYYHIQAANTVDEYIWEALQGKSDVAEGISKALLAKHRKED